MMTSKNPGRFGVYGFRNRTDHSYKGLAIATSESVTEKTIWDILARYGKKSIVVGVPPAYPPKKINGIMTGCFLTPDENSSYTYPAGVKDEINKEVGEYILDVRIFRTDDKERLLKHG